MGCWNKNVHFFCCPLSVKNKYNIWVSICQNNNKKNLKYICKYVVCHAITHFVLFLMVIIFNKNKYIVSICVWKSVIYSLYCLQISWFITKICPKVHIITERFGWQMYVCINWLLPLLSYPVFTVLFKIEKIFKSIDLWKAVHCLIKLHFFTAFFLMKNVMNFLHFC